MTFTDAIDSCFRKYATFKGRASRSEYWWWAVFVLVGTIATAVIHERLSAGFTVVTFLPYLAVTTRRLHDTDRSGWWQLISIVPLLGIILLIIWLGQAPREPNRFEG